MTLGISGSSASSPAAPHDKGLKIQSQRQNTRSDEAASRRAEKQADTEQAEARSQQIVKKVLDIQTADEKALSSSRIDTYA